MILAAEWLCKHGPFQLTDILGRQVTFHTLLGTVVRRGETLKLLTTAVREVGPAAQTLAGITALTNKETFVSTTDIARWARLPVATVRKHLKTLASCGWIRNAGREQTRRGRPRRTCTIRLTDRTKDAMTEYFMLPWWACIKPNSGMPNRIKPNGGKRLPWSARLLLALITSRLAGYVAAAARVEGRQYTEQEWWGLIDDVIGNGDGTQRFAFSLSYLEHETGMERETIVAAKKFLADPKQKMIDWKGGNKDANGSKEKDTLAPNRLYAVAITDLPNGKCFIGYDHRPCDFAGQQLDMHS